jgi:hypothetical protein
LINQNLCLKGGFKSFKLIVCKKMINKYMAIVEMDGDSFKKIMTLKTVSIGFDRCSIFEYFKVTRYFGCGGYNHIIANCKEEKLCLKCGENTHSDVDCLNPAKCVNCERVNKLHNLNLGTSHLCYDVNCELWKHQVEKRSIKCFEFCFSIFSVLETNLI